MDKQLRDKAIDIKGSQYVLVSDRIIYFNENYPNGSIVTDLISDPLSDVVIVKATVFPDMANPARTFTGYSQAVKGAGFINKTAALENAETSAVGRALAMLGIGVIDSVASVDEINKAQGTDPKLAKAKQDVWQLMKTNKVDSYNTQIDLVETILGKRTIDTVEEAKKVIEALSEK